MHYEYFLFNNNKFLYFLDTRIYEQKRYFFTILYARTCIF